MEREGGHTHVCLRSSFCVGCYPSTRADQASVQPLAREIARLQTHLICDSDTTAPPACWQKLQKEGKRALVLEW